MKWVTKFDLRLFISLKEFIRQEEWIAASKISFDQLAGLQNANRSIGLLRRAAEDILLPVEQRRLELMDPDDDVRAESAFQLAHIVDTTEDE